MTHTPKISVLMPAYNAEAYIAQAIDSILAQTYTDFECIIIDDGSSDRTWEIIQEYASKDTRIQAYQNEVNLRICKTRNRLLSYAKGEYIAWMDADDISVADRLEKQMNYLDLNTDVGIVGGYMNLIDENGKLIGKRTYIHSDTGLRKVIFFQSPVAQPACMIRKTVLDKAGVYDDSLLQAEDLDMSFRLGMYAKFANLDQVVLNYRVHNQSISNDKLKENIEYTLQVRDRYKDSEHYIYTTKDYIVHTLTGLIKILPNKLIVLLFNFMRNDG